MKLTDRLKSLRQIEWTTDAALAVVMGFYSLVMIYATAEVYLADAEYSAAISSILFNLAVVAALAARQSYRLHNKESLVEEYRRINKENRETIKEYKIKEDAKK